MAKVAIKNENITSFGGIYHIMDVFSKLGFEKLTESVLGKRGSSGKAFCYGSIFGSLFFSYLCGVRCQTKVHNCKCSYLCCNFILLFSEILLLIEFCFIVSLIFLIFSPCPKYTSLGVRLSNDS